MQQFSEIFKTLGSMPPTTLNGVVMLAVIALAGFAIYAIMIISKGKQ